MGNYHCIVFLILGVYFVNFVVSLLFSLPESLAV